MILSFLHNNFYLWLDMQLSNASLKRGNILTRQEIAHQNIFYPHAQKHICPLIHTLSLLNLKIDHLEKIINFQISSLTTT